MGLIQKLKLDWIWLQLSYPFRWAHHPTCDPYSDQRFDLHIKGKQVSFCQGCSLVTIGIVISTLIMSFLLLFTSMYSLVILGLIIIIPIFPVIVIDGKGLSRSFKRFARLMLGHSTGSAIALILFYPDWIIKIGVIICLILAKFAYETFRNYSPSADLCQTCKFLTDAPYCPGMKDQMEANKKYQELALPIVSSSFRQKVEDQYVPPIEDSSSISRDQHDTNTNQQDPDNVPSFEVVWVDEEETI